MINGSMQTSKTQIARQFSKVMTSFRFFLRIALFTALGGCLSPVDRFTDYTGGQYVIFGQVSSLKEQTAVFVSRTAFTERLPDPVEGATVVLIDELNNRDTFKTDPLVAGKYVLENFPGIPGRIYHVQVQLPSGKTFESIPEKMPIIIGDDDIYYTIEPEEYTDHEGIVSERYFLKIYSNHTLPPADQHRYIRWHVEETYILSPTDFPDPWGMIPPPCFISQQVDPQRIVLFDDEDVDVSHLADFHIVSRLIDATFKERHYFTTFQSSLTKGAYEYWRKVDVAANQVGSIFDQPPARVKGNIFNSIESSEEVLGYFQAVNQSYDRFYTLPDGIPFPLAEHCEYRPDRDYYSYPSECLDCRQLRNSSYVRPPWF